MTDTGTSCAFIASIDRHFNGRIAPDEEHRMREHLPVCPLCRDRYRAQLLLARLDPHGEEPSHRLARGLGLGTWRRFPRLTLASLMLAGAATLLLLLARPDRSPDDGAFQARGGSGQGTVRLLVYQLHPGGRAQPATGIVGRRDELAFAYQNRAGWKRLLVFAADARKHVYWYYPAWTNPSDRPEAIAIATGPALVELGEGIAHDLEPGRLRIFGVFARRTIPVDEVEHAVAAAAADARTLPLTDTAQVVHELEVAP
jgi:hypothetical protein